VALPSVRTEAARVTHARDLAAARAANDSSVPGNVVLSGFSRVCRAHEARRHGSPRPSTAAITVNFSASSPSTGAPLGVPPSVTNTTAASVTCNVSRALTATVSDANSDAGSVRWWVDGVLMAPSTSSMVISGPHTIEAVVRDGRGGSTQSASWPPFMVTPWITSTGFYDGSGMIIKSRDSRNISVRPSFVSVPVQRTERLSRWASQARL
jgi:hypothetical protein